MVVFFGVGLFCGSSPAATLEDSVSAAMQTLSATKGDPGLLMLTDAPYVRVNGKSALSYLDRAQALTGCTVGKGNLLFFQRPQTHPLRLLLMKKSENNDAVIISRKDDQWTSETLRLSPANLASPAFWESVKDSPLGRDVSALATIANVWAQDGPYDFLKSAELHNHICPGLTSGYLLAHYILDHYPLKQGEHYTIVACPVWCKEDAFQVVMDCTPGKKGLIVKRLSKQQQDNISVPNPAGMVLIWDAKKKTGRGAALSFDSDGLRALAPKDATKPARVLAALSFLDKPDRFVTTGAEFELNEDLFNRIIQAGNNPYAVCGLSKQ
jgi:formylmethanofuran dehydrogenase subunit E-like metal-binding protein